MWSLKLLGYVSCFTLLWIGVSHGQAQTYTPQTPTTVAYAGEPLSSPDIPLTDPRLARSVYGNEPEEINVVLLAATKVLVSWSTGNQTVAPGSPPVPAANSVPSVVKYGTSSGFLGQTAQGSSSAYTVTPAVAAGDTYVSGLIHNVVLDGLLSSQKYYYQVGDGQGDMSATLSFSTLDLVVPGSFKSYRVGVFADLGLTTNSSVTVSHLAASGSNIFFNIGDFFYADDYSPNAANRWDGGYRFLQQLYSDSPYIATEGNHEIEAQANGVEFAAYNNRFGNFVAANGDSGSPYYYSLNIPGIHVVVIGAYADYSVGGAQYNWLQQDLASVNRLTTPFILAFFHPPVYNTYRSHYKEFECLRIAFEPLLFNAGVDLVLHGHVHAYERTNRVYNYTVNPCGPTYITVGDGGNIEGLQTAHVDDPGQCPSPNGNACITYQPADVAGGGQQNGYCPPKQPPWSAFRESAFGHGTLDVTASALTWNWHRNQDGEAVVSDSIVITRDAACPNHL